MDLEKMSPTEKDRRDEVAVRVASLVYVWDGTKGDFLSPDEFVRMKKDFKVAEKEADGVLLAAPVDDVATPDWDEILKQRKKEEGPETAFWEHIVRFRHHDLNLAKATLVTYWERGKFVDELERTPGKYGNKTVKKAADELKTSPSTLYLCQRFAALYKDQRVLELSKREVPWNTVTQLLAIKDEKRREQVETDYLNGKLNAKNLPAAIKKVRLAEREQKQKEGAKVDRRGGPGLSRTFDSVKTMAEKMDAKLSEFSEASKAYLKLPEDRQRSLKASRKGAEAGLVRLYKRLLRMIGEPSAKEAETKGKA